MTSVYARTVNERRIGATIGSRKRAAVIHQNGPQILYASSKIRAS